MIGIHIYEDVLLKIVKKKNRKNYEVECMS